jgi:uncharacterized protein YggE
MKPLRLVLLCAGVAAIVAFVGVGLPARARSADAQPTTRTITVSGTGTVSATPTQAGFEFGVSTRSKTAQQALSDDSTQMRKLIAALEAAGIPAAALQTSSVSLDPVRSGDDSTIVGYSASNTVSATVNDLSKAGAVVDAAVAAGANEVDGPNLTVADQTAFYDQALKAAAADARAKAQVLAAAGGLQVGAVASVEENTGNAPLPFAQSAADSTSTPIQAGTQQVTASVTVVFDAS